MIDLILCVRSEYTHSKLEALSKLLINVEHIHVYGVQCQRWEQMIECSLHITALSYSESECSKFMQKAQIVCI